MFKGLSNLASIMKQAQQMGGRMEEMSEELKSQRVTGSAGAGLVEVEANGAGEVLSVKIDPTLIENQDREMIEDLLPAAVNQANAKAKALHLEAMQGLTEGLSLPGLNEAMSRMTGQSPFDLAGAMGDAVNDESDPETGNQGQAPSSSTSNDTSSTDSSSTDSSSSEATDKP